MSISPPDAGTGCNSSINKAEGGRDWTPRRLHRARAGRGVAHRGHPLSLLLLCLWFQEAATQRDTSQCQMNPFVLGFFLSAALKRDWPHRIMSLPRVLRCSRAAPADWSYVSLKYINQNKESSLVTSRLLAARQRYVSTSFLKLLQDSRFTIRQNTSICSL